MRKKSILILTGIVLVGMVCLWFWTQNKPAGQAVVKNLNKAVSNYTDMNIKDDKTYSLSVFDVQMLVTTYLPEYTIFGVSPDEYTVRPNQIDEALTTEQDLPICDFEHIGTYRAYYSERGCRHAGSC